MRTDRLRAPEGAWALVTGATSGIGEAYARALAGLGYRLLLTGRRERELREVARSLGEGRADTHITELSRPPEVEGLIEACRGREIRVLVNNAGFGSAGAFPVAELADQLRMLEVHAAAPMRLMRELVPDMVRRGVGYVVNVSSLASFFPLPESATYCATKAFLRYFTESLAMEVASTGVRCQVLCPGLTRTHFHAALGVPLEAARSPALWMSAEEVVRSSLRALDRGTVVCVPGLRNRLLRRLGAAIPRRLYYRILSAVRPQRWGSAPRA